MRRTIAYPYIALGFILFCWINMPKNIADRWRSFTVALFSHPLGDAKPAELSRLQLENQTLHSQLEAMYEWLSSDGKISEQWELLKNLALEEDKSAEKYWRSFFERRASHLRKSMQSQMLALPARVIYRDPSAWSSSLWDNAGEQENQALGQAVITKNSPVVSGAALIGVVDYVGKKQSRIRLITDSGLSPSVRAVRGAAQNRELAALIQAISIRLENRSEFFSSLEEKESFLKQLESLKSKIQPGWEEGYLAKGELRGSSFPFWRSRGQTLKGVGFNFDYPDEEGPARELRTGRPVGSYVGAVPILKEGDLLVTSGLDGIFPPGLFVATVSSIGPLQEGGYAYDIEAKPCAMHLNDIQTVFILPSLSSE